MRHIGPSRLSVDRSGCNVLQERPLSGAAGDLGASRKQVTL